MRVRYDKLVRDRIPEIIAEHGRACETRVLDAEEYRKALLAKLVEEAEEAAADDGELAKELGDVLEVVDAVVAAYGLDRGALEALRAKRRASRGGFEDRIMLVWGEAEE